MKGHREFPFCDIRYALPSDDDGGAGGTGFRSGAGGGGRGGFPDPGIEGLTDTEWFALLSLLGSVSRDGGEPPSAA